MPGIFGAIACPPVCRDRLAQEFAAIWPETTILRLGDGMLGGHAHPPSVATHSLSDGTCVAVDGETGLYSAAASLAASSGAALWSKEPEGIRLDSPFAGNLVVAHPGSGRWSVAADLVGSFPLYYTTAGGGFMFSSLLRPLACALARALPAQPDLIGIIQWMRSPRTQIRRSYYQDIHPLLPGQVADYDAVRASFQIRETSDIWARTDSPAAASPEDLADGFWEDLCSTLGSIRELGPVGLMLSGGWDSRVLLAGLRQPDAGSEVLCYSHGDLRSRELGIIRRLCATSKVDFVAQPLGADVYDPAFLDETFPKAETAVFPEWLYAGSVLASRGIRTAMTGLGGEILGGFFGQTKLKKGVRKIPTLLQEMSSSSARQSQGGEPDLAAMGRLIFEPGPKPWYLAEDAWAQMPGSAEEIKADVDWGLRRLVERGVRSNAELAEAFLSEYRIGANFNGQAHSARVSVDASSPFFSRDLLRLASAIPMHLKVHNKLDRLILLRHAPDLADPPTAATLLPAAAPILLQEASRLLRRVNDSSRWRLHSATKGLAPQPRTGWWELEFLRDGLAFRRMVDDLETDIWDRKAIQARIARNAQDRAGLDWRSTTALLAQQLLRITTIDRMLR